MRIAWGVALLALFVLAGCSGTTSTTTTDAPSAAPYALACGQSNWDDPCTVRASPNESPSKAEIDVAVNPLDANNVVVASKDKDPLASDGCVWAVAQATKDGGRTWTTTYVGGALADRSVGDLLHGWRCITDPILQFGNDGTLYYSLQAYDYEGLGLPVVGTPLGPVPPELGFMFQAVSHDGGLTFPEIKLLHAGDETVVFHDYMRMGVNPRTGTVYTIWNQLTGVGPVGQSVPVTVPVVEGSPVAEPPSYFPKTDVDDPGPDVSLGESGIVGTTDGTMYAFLGGFNSPNEAWFSTSTNDGTTWSVPQKAFDFIPMGSLESHAQANGTEYDPQYRTGTSVEIAADTSQEEHDGCLYTAWADGAADVADIVTSRSCDQGRTWSTPRLVSVGPHEDAQWMPRIAVDEHGNLHVVYLTRAYDPLHNLVDAEWAYSTDQGQTWNVTRVTKASFDGNRGIHQDGFPFLGDYIGIGSSHGVTYLGFPDCHTGTCEIAVAKVLPNEEALHGEHQHDAR